MTKLALAVRARLPLIAVSTDTTHWAVEVLKTVTTAPLSYSVSTGRGRAYPLTGGVYYQYGTDGGVPAAAHDCYSLFAKAGACLIIINPTEVLPCMFDAGPLLPTEGMVRSFVTTMAADDEVAGLVSALHGLSYKAMSEVSQLAMAHSGSFTAKAVRHIRQSMYGEVGGLRQVDTDDLLMYWPHPPLEQWLVENQRLVSPDVPRVLRPRGLLFWGDPGTGKTLGAKYVARQLGLPLYLLDIGGMLSKWQGESDKNLISALAQAEANSPCVMLLDEAEKIFETGDDSGAGTRMLATLLWWLQEHKSTVLTVLTTNWEAKLPPEMIRPGRIDSSIGFGKLTYGHATLMAREMARRLEALATIKQIFFHEGEYPSHAEVAERVLKEVRKMYLTNQTD